MTEYHKTWEPQSMRFIVDGEQVHGLADGNDVVEFDEPLTFLTVKLFAPEENELTVGQTHDVQIRTGAEHLWSRGLLILKKKVTSLGEGCCYVKHYFEENK